MDYQYFLLPKLLSVVTPPILGLSIFVKVEGKEEEINAWLKEERERPITIIAHRQFRLGLQEAKGEKKRKSMRFRRRERS